MEQEKKRDVSQSSQCTPESQDIALHIKSALPTITLFFQNPFATKGTIPVASTEHIAPGETLTVTTTSSTCEFNRKSPAFK